MIKPMECVQELTSKDGSTRKFVFHTGWERSVVEFSHIDNGTGKDIICAPTQTMCDMGCKFCHTSDYIGKINTNSLASCEISIGVQHIMKSMDIKGDRPLLLSYMGCGEPLLSVPELLDSMRYLHIQHPFIRFAMATMMPKNSLPALFDLSSAVIRSKIPLKMHLSLHYTEDETRKEYMPAAMDIRTSMLAMRMYKESTGNEVEIHYSLMDGINDSGQDISRLIQLVEGTGFNVKFLYHNTKDNVSWDGSSPAVVKSFMKALSSRGIDNEYYVPPGLDVGASCGQFLMDQY